MSSKESMSTGSIQSGLDWSEFQYLDVDHFPPIKMKNGSNVEWTFLYFRYINFAFPLFSEYQFECSNLSPILLHSMYLMVHLCPNVEVSNERIERHFAYCQILQGNSAEWPDPTSTVSLYLLSVFRSIKYPNQQNVNVGIKLALRYGHHISLSGGTHFRHRNQHMVTLESKGFSKPWYIFKTLAFDYDSVTSYFLQTDLCCPSELDTTQFLVLSERQAFNYYADDEVAFFHSMLINIFKRNYPRIRKGHSTFEGVQHFSTELEHWKEKLPFHLIPPPELSPSPSAEDNYFMGSYVYSLYCFCLLIVHTEPFFKHLEIGYLESPSIYACLDAVIQIDKYLAHVGVYDKKAIFVLSQHCVFSFFIAAFATALCKISHQKILKPLIKRQHDFTENYPAFYPGRIVELMKWMKSPKRTMLELKSLV